MKRPSTPIGIGKVTVAAGALMLWVALGPWAWGYAGSRAAVASHIFFVFAFGPLALLVLVLRPAALVFACAGLWLAASPWLLGYATNHAAWLSELVTGALISVIGAHAAGITIPAQRRRRADHPQTATAPPPAEAAGTRP